MILLTHKELIRSINAQINLFKRIKNENFNFDFNN